LSQLGLSLNVLRALPLLLLHVLPALLLLLLLQPKLSTSHAPFRTAVPALLR
jgi:hypothetical protein